MPRRWRTAWLCWVESDSTQVVSPGVVTFSTCLVHLDKNRELAAAAMPATMRDSWDAVSTAHLEWDSGGWPPPLLLNAELDSGKQNLRVHPAGIRVRTVNPTVISNQDLFGAHPTTYDGRGSHNLCVWESFQLVSPWKPIAKTHPLTCARLVRRECKNPENENPEHQDRQANSTVPHLSGHVSVLVSWVGTLAVFSVVEEPS